MDVLLTRVAVRAILIVLVAAYDACLVALSGFTQAPWEVAHCYDHDRSDHRARTGLKDSTTARTGIFLVLPYSVTRGTARPDVTALTSGDGPSVGADAIILGLEVAKSSVEASRGMNDVVIFAFAPFSDENVR